MRNLWLSLVVAAFATLMLAPGVAAQWEEYTSTIDDMDFGMLNGSGTEDDPYEVESGDPRVIGHHLEKEGHEGELYHIEDLSVHIWHVGGGDTTWDWQWIAQPCEWHQYCEPYYPWGVLTLDGEPCNTVAIETDVTVWSEEQGYAGPIWSNAIYYHIVPEPATFTPLAGLFLGAASIGWFRLRKS